MITNAGAVVFEPGRHFIVCSVNRRVHLYYTYVLFDGQGGGEHS